MTWVCVLTDGTILDITLNKMTMKARQMIGCIKHFSNGNFTKETQRILSAAQIYIDHIESIQKQFVIHLLESRSNATTYRLAPYEDRCKLLKLQSLEKRRTVEDAVLAFNIYNRQHHRRHNLAEFCPKRKCL